MNDARSWAEAQWSGGPMYATTVEADTVDGWAITVELNGYEGTLPEVTRRISRGSRAIVIYSGAKGSKIFKYAIDGDIVRQFDPLLYDNRSFWHGEAMTEEAGLVFGIQHPLASTFLCAERLTGVHLTQERLDDRSEAIERSADVPDELHLGLVRRVDLGRLGVDVDDPLRAVGVPASRGVLHEVVADAHDEVRSIESGQDVIPGLRPDGHQRKVRSIVDHALAHERRGNRDVEGPGQGSQLRRGPPPEDAVAGEDQGSFGRGDEPRRVVDRLVGRLGEVGPSGAERPNAATRRIGRGAGKVLR